MKDFRFFHRLRVRWAEVDMQKIVFNAHYLMYFDTAISAYWRALALPYEETMLQLGGDLYVKKATVEYHGSARFDEQLDVALRCARVGNSSLLFEGAIFRDGKKLISAELVYVFADPTTQTSKPVPDTLRQLLLKYEAGQAMVNISTGDWATLGPDIRPLRQEVFVAEQGMPAELVESKSDETALHVLIRNGLDKAVACGRLLSSNNESGNEPANKTALAGRIAVRQLLRGSQLGSDVLHCLIKAAADSGHSHIGLDARQSAQIFYQRLGFAPVGEPFVELDIPHIHMTRQLGSI